MKDIISSIIIIIFSITIFIISDSYGEGSTMLSEDASLFPQIISGILGMLGLYLLITAVVKKEGTKIEIDKKVLVKVFSLIIMLILYIPVLQIFGYIVATVVFLFGMMVFLGSSIKQSSITSVIISGVLYVIFAVFFKVPLPSGLLW